MLKKLCLTSLALVFGSSAFAQTAPVTTTTNYSSAVTIKSANNCSITGATSLTYDSSTNTITAVGGNDSCAGGNPPPNVAAVSLSITPTSYTLGQTGATPVINVTNNTSPATVTCTLTPTNGFTVTSASTITNSGTFTLSAPTAAGTFTFAPVCTTSTSGYTVSVSPAAVSLVVNPSNPQGGCDPSQTATVATKTLQRQCTGSMNVWPGGTSYSGPLTDLGAVLGGKNFPTYSYAGYSPTFTITSGYYIALAFTPTASGAIQFSANPSYGDGGVISLATQPGSLMQGSPGVICSLTRGGNNSLYVASAAGSICQVQAGTTYYVNLADVDTLGNNLCYGGKANTCGTSLVSYTLYTSK